jgi:flagellar hook protein FlgE
MPLTGALYSGVSGINTNGNAMNVIGDNIANVNTVGFKGSRAVFADLLSVEMGGAQIGTGSRLVSADRIFAQGGIESSNNITDMAIQGNGLFVLKNNEGATFYTRAGQFNLNEDGVLVNPQGLKVQGVQLNIDGTAVSGLSDIALNNRLLVAPTATSKITLSGNFDSTATTPVLPPPADALGTEGTSAEWFSSSNFSTIVTVYDSLGDAHDLTFLYGKIGNDMWSYRVVTPSSDITGGTPGKLIQVSDPGGVLEFNPDGTINLGGATNVTSITFDFNNGSEVPQVITGGIPGDLSITDFTQYAVASSVSTLNQNGVKPGTLTGISVDEKGLVTGLFSSGLTQALYRVALADFTNPEGLTHVGNSLFRQAAEAGDVIYGDPGTGGFGSVLSSSLELSTVDLAAEFVRMVITQRGFQANSRTITVTDSLLEEISNLKR